MKYVIEEELGIKIKRNKYFLLENDVVVLRNGDRGIVTKDNIILQNGGYFLRYIYEKRNTFAFDPTDGETKYDIVKIYHDNTSEAVFFNLAKNDKFLVWEEKKVNPFPKLKNGDVVILNNDNIYMKVDHTFVNQKGGYMSVDKYDIDGNFLDDKESNHWDIKKVYRNNWYTDKKYYAFEVTNFKDCLIWERC